jgi:hypothetical protein
MAKRKVTNNDLENIHIKLKIETLVIVRITLNVRQMPLKFPLNNGVAIVQKLVVKLSNTSVNVISICCENVV